MKTLILATLLIINTVAPGFEGKVTTTWIESGVRPHLVIRAQDLDGMVYGWCVDEKGWHEFEAESPADYIEAGFKACREAK